MATPSTPASRRDPEALLQHLGSVYHFAQVLAADSDQAVHLVEQTYFEAYQKAPALEDESEIREWLLQQLIQLWRSRQPVHDEPEAGSRPLENLRQRLAGEYVARTLPGVFVTLPERDRMLLLLCDVEGLSAVSAAAILGIETEDVVEGLHYARRRIVDALRAEATPTERALLDERSPETWLSDALARCLRSLLGPLPPTLRPRVRAVAESRTTSPLLPPPAVEAPAQPDLRPASRAPRRRIFQRALAAIVLILGVGLIGYVLTRVFSPRPETNLITLSARDGGEVRTTFRTNSPQQAERFIFDRLGWRLTLPTIDGADLEGVELRAIANDVVVPVFLYDDDTSGEPISLFVYSYALLDRHGNRLRLAPDILRQIQNREHFDLHEGGELGENKVLVWRNRDDIYVAVTPGNAERLRERIIFPT